MVDSQIHPNGVTMPALLQIFESVPREVFLPDNLQSVAYNDEDIALGEGRFMLEPSVHARMIQAAQPQPGDIALDIGCGTGYSTAVLSTMVSTVVALESSDKLLTQARAHWTAMGVCNVVMIDHALKKGAPEQGPYNIIMFNGAVAQVPRDIVSQLAPDGRLIAVVKKPGNTMGEVTVARHLGEGRFASHSLFNAATPYLKGFEPTKSFSF